MRHYTIMVILIFLNAMLCGLNVNNGYYGLAVVNFCTFLFCLRGLK